MEKVARSEVPGKRIGEVITEGDGMMEQPVQHRPDQHRVFENICLFPEALVAGQYE